MDLVGAAAAVTAAVDALREADPDQSPATELREVLLRLKVADSKLQAQLGCLTHAADRAGVFIGTGARDTAEWLAGQTGTSTGRNRADADLGAAMHRSTDLAAAVTSGELSTDKAKIVSGVCGDLAVDQHLLDEIAELPLHAVTPATEGWRARTDTHHDTDIATSQRARRNLRLTSTPDGMTRLEGLLDPEAGAIVRSTLDGIMNQSIDDRGVRTRDQRCADALTQLAAAAAKGDLAGGRSNTKLLATVAFDTIVERGTQRGTTHVGPTLDAATIRKLACDAGIHRVITAPGSSILDFGHETRLVPDNLYLALIARDERCRWPGCSIRATWCDAHHIVHWADHGPTNDHNCVLLCHHHHQLSHQPGWHLTGNSRQLVIHHPDGTTQTSRPPGAAPPRAGTPGREPPNWAGPTPDTTNPHQLTLA